MKNLMQRIIDVRKQVDYIQKDKSVSTGGGSYKAVTHDAVTGILREHMNAAGIVCFPSLVSSVALAKEEGAKQFRYEATYDFTFVNADEPSDRIVVRIEAHAMDNADKAPGKALSYAKKYAMLKLFEIETGEDEESRYNDFDVIPYLEAIEQSKTVEELEKAHEEAKQAAHGQKDRSIHQAISSVHAKTKKRIIGPEPLAPERFAKAIEAVKAGRVKIASLRSDYALTLDQIKTLDEMES